MRRSSFLKTASNLLLSALVALPTFATPITFGSLSNFDVINDTGETCHGFEIELEGISPSDIYGTFGSPYIRYGDPTISATATGSLIRYASTFGPSGWTTGTPMPAAPFTTGGHALFYPQYGGDANYLTAGGEHFGVALNLTPTNTTYRWLLGDATGNLYAAGSNVTLPAPVLTVQQPVNPAAPAAVQAVAQAIPNDNPNREFGDALWVKVFVQEAPEKVELDQLVWGNAAVPKGDDAAEVEVEWQLLQDGKANEVDSGLKDLANDSKSITRRYEFYKYIGGYDPENHEALVDDAIKNPEAVGDFIGDQNVAIVLDQAVAVPEVSSFALIGVCVAFGLGYRKFAGHKAKS